MTTAQIRDSVLKTQTIEERVQSFVDTRIQKLSAPPAGGQHCPPFWALHVVPLVRQRKSIDVTSEHTIRFLTDKMNAPYGGSPIHCLEGFKVRHRDSDGDISYGLAFRDGTIEFVDQKSLRPSDDDPVLACQFVHELIATCLEKALTIYKEGVLTPPLAVCLTFVELFGFRLPNSLRLDWIPIPHGPISADPIIVTDVTTDAHEILRPFMDVVWNAFGEPRCPAYGNDGAYERYRNIRVSPP